MRRKVLGLLPLLSLCAWPAAPARADEVHIDPERCQALAEEVYAKCKAIGGEDDACAQMRDAFLERCLAAAEPQPEPDPGDCAAKCAALAEEVKARCAQEGGSEERCTQLAADALAACRRGCEPIPIGCKDRCLAAAGEARHRCAEAGGSREQCEAVFESTLTACVAKCEEPPMPPQPPPTCEDVCVHKVREFVQACNAEHPDAAAEPGEPDGDGDCEARGAELLERCLAGCEPVPPPTCEDRCKHAAMETYEKCKAEGIDPAECDARAHRVLGACLEQCGGPEPPPPPTCDERCAALASKAYDECVAGGGVAEECRSRSEAMLKECLDRCDVPPPPNCADRCAAAAKEVLEACLMEPGADPTACEEKARHFLRECRMHCEIPLPPNCDDRCAELAHKVAAECADAGGSEEECRAKAEAARQACVDGCSEPPPPPDPCDVRCKNRAAMLREACVAEGGDPETCTERAREFFEECRENCDQGPRPPCSDRCEFLVHRVLAECLEQGGDIDACRERAKEVLSECLRSCPPHPVPCVLRCAEEARGRFARCIERLEEEIKACVDAGGDPEDCKEKAIDNCRKSINEFLVACLQGCIENPEPPEPPTCPERCEAAGAKVKAECLAAGGAEDECVRAEEDFLASCREACENPPDPCEFDCEAASKRLEARCVESGVDPAECAQRASEFLAQCQDRLAEHCREEMLAVTFGLPNFIRGDANMDSREDISDAIQILRVLFQGQGQLPCADAADANDDGRNDISDPIMVLSHLFTGGPGMPPPNAPGQDPTFDDLLCE